MASVARSWACCGSDRPAGNATARTRNPSTSAARTSGLPRDTGTSGADIEAPHPREILTDRSGSSWRHGDGGRLILNGAPAEWLEQTQHGPRPVAHRVEDGAAQGLRSA